MKRKYTHDDISKFIQKFKLLENSFTLDKVHLLLNNPNAKATHKLHKYSKHLKFIITIGIMLAGFLTLFLLLSPNNNLETNSSKEILIVKNDVTEKKEYIPSSEIITPDKTKKATGHNSIKTIPVTIDSSEMNEIQINDAIIDELEPLKHIKIENNVNFSEVESQNCNWPLDTIIDKSTLLVELTDQELAEIGIIKSRYKTDNEKYRYAIYYDNLTPNGIPASSNHQSQYIPVEKKVQTHFDFYRVTNTTIDYEPYFQAEVFYTSLDTLVPIILRIGDSTTMNQPDEIFWFNPHESLFKKLPSRYHYLQDVYKNLCCLKIKYPEKSFTNYLSPMGNNIFKPVNSLDLSNDELQQLGLNIVDNCIVLQSKDLLWYSTSCRGNNSRKNNGYYDSIDIVRISKSSFPILETDTLGRVFRYKPYNSSNYTIAEKNMDILVPIKINKNNLLNTRGYKSEIWWFYPTDEFINLLPDRIKEDLKIERDAILSESFNESSECTYFEVCKSNLDIENLKVYPNPIRTNFTIEFNLNQAVNGMISLTNIMGSQIKTIVDQKEFSIGFNSFEGNIGEIQPGIYILSIETNKGFQTQRIIKSK